MNNKDKEFYDWWNENHDCSSDPDNETRRQIAKAAWREREKRLMNRNHIFSGDYSRDMWEAINKIKGVSDAKDALILVCCRLQELETRLSTKEEG